MFQRVSFQLVLSHKNVSRLKRSYSYKIVRIEPLKPVTTQHIEEITKENQDEVIRDAIQPLRNVPYSEQLSMKDDWTSYVISRYYTIMDTHMNPPKAKKRQPLPPRPRILNICPSVSK
ncbi:Putative beta-hexosaminidase [Frankliniella fusca]|uniref:Beta-hexosaminidase n=1 Tax=Frankliniella fusca TaxID=407009 RepID=A0AAE1H194_9NEOP|nr:Putative beta-hexosaminidase [Frankliniella fusca]